MSSPGLTNLLEIEPAPGYRIVYSVLEERVRVLIVAAGRRERKRIYRAASERTRALCEKTDAECTRLADLLRWTTYELPR